MKISKNKIPLKYFSRRKIKILMEYLGISKNVWK
jgi:hypothetical protein